MIYVGVQDDASNLLHFFYDELVTHNKSIVKTQDILEKPGWDGNRINLAYRHLYDSGLLKSTNQVGNIKGAQRFLVTGLNPKGIDVVEYRRSGVQSNDVLRHLSILTGDESLLDPNKRTSPLRIFLCHSSGDKPEVRNLYQRLSSNGFDPWLDEEKLLPGQEWELEIAKAVQTSDIIIVCLSHKAINKAGYVQKEIKFALDKAKEQPEGTIFLIPLKLEECDVPERLKRWHWVNLFEEKGYERLMSSLRLRAETITP